MTFFVKLMGDDGRKILGCVAVVDFGEARAPTTNRPRRTIAGNNYGILFTDVHAYIADD